MSKILFLIPARGGSKEIPHKNIKILGNKPLINYSIEFARKFADDADICVSTDDDKIIKVVSESNLKIPFQRPENISTDFSTTDEVIEHALNYYKSKGINYDIVVLIQPTSPFREEQDLMNMLNEFNESIDIIASVCIPKSNPYFTLFEENKQHLLVRCKKSNSTRRQDAEKVYAFNGSIYIINAKTFRIDNLSKKKIKKYLMQDPIYSIDIDEELDWLLAETILNKKNNTL